MTKKEQDAAYYRKNRSRILSRSLEYQARNYNRVRNNSLKRNYGITSADFDALLLRQGGKCAMCHTDNPGGHGNQFHVDHDHATGRVRGLLCHHCNTGLGKLGDDPLKAANMLARYAIITNAN